MKKEIATQLAPAVRAFKAAELSKGVNCRYWVLDAKGGLWKDTVDYCHAALRRLPARYDPVAVLNQVQDLRSGEDVAKRFYEWLFNYSPFRNTFQTKSVKRVLDRGVMVADAEAPANMMMGGLMSARLAWEDYGGNGNYRLCMMWDRLVQLGVHPHAAFIVVHRYKIDPQMNKIWEMDYLHRHSGVEWGENSFWNFLDEKHTAPMRSYREEKSYDKVTSLWSLHKPKGKPSITSALDQALSRVGKSKGGSNNPFNVEAIEVGKTYPFNEAVEEIALAIKNTINIENKLAA